ncbi:MAG: protein kinase [Planctomycetes bacterium]|nr:protein kinase [Planctomycetota bacterium]
MDASASGRSAHVDRPSFGARYEALRLLGRGGFGEVWLAQDLELKREVAIKALRGGDAEDLARFQREARLAARIRHPSVVSIYDVGERFLVMEYIPGAPPDPFSLSPKEAAGIVRQAAEGVAAAHAEGVIHRDLKPANILVAQGRAVVTDFGLARALAGDPSLTASGTIFGTPAYMPPEQAEGKMRELDARSDVYSLGATLYHLLARRPPYVGSTPVEIITRALAGPPEPIRRANPKVAPGLAAIVERAMEKNPTRRYADAGELARDLARFLAGQRPRAALRRARVERGRRRFGEWARRRIGFLAGAGIALAGLAGAAALLVFLGDGRNGGEAAPGSSDRDQVAREHREHIEKAREALLEAEFVARTPEPDPALLSQRLDLAIREATSAIEADPSSKDALSLRAEALAAKGDLEGAERDLSRALSNVLRESSGGDDRLRLRRAWVRAQIYQAARELPLPVSHRGALERVVSPRETDRSRELRERVEQDLTWAAGRFSGPESDLALGVLALADGNAGRAAELFDSAGRARPYDPVPFLYRALARMAVADFPRAIPDLERSLAIRPASPQALLALALCEYARADYPASLALVERAEKLAADRAPLARLRGSLAAATGDRVGSRAAFDEALAVNPEDGFARLLDYLARREALEGEPEVHPWTFTTSLPKSAAIASELDSLVVPALESGACPALLWLYHGQHEIVLGNDAEAERALAKAVEIDPRLGAAHVWRTVVALRSGEWELAKEALVLAFDNLGRESEALQNLLVEVRERAGGKKLLDRLAEAGRREPEPGFAALFLRHWLGYADRAAPGALDAARVAAPEGWERHLLEAIARDAAGDDPGAAREIEEALRGHPDSSFLGTLHVQWSLGRTEVIEGYRALVDRNPFDSLNQFNFADVLARQGDRGEVLELLRKNTYFYSPKGFAHDDLGMLAAWWGTSDEEWRRWVRLSSKPASMWYALANARRLRGDFAGAVEAADRAVAIDPEHIYALWVGARSRLRLGRERESAARDALRVASDPWLGAEGPATLAACRWGLGDALGAAEAFELLAKTTGRPAHLACAAAIRARAGGAWKFTGGEETGALFQTLFEAGDLEELGRAVEDALAVPRTTEQYRSVALLYRSRLRELAGDTGRALADLRDAVVAAGGSPLYALVLSRMLLDAGRPADALGILEQVRDKADLTATPWLLGRAYAALSRFPEAAAALAEYEKIGWKDDEAPVMGPPPSRGEFERLLAEVRRAGG